jgi:hypothetical protein
MALKFGDAAGQAVKDRADSYKIKDGVNSVRLVGDLVARYVYWIKGENGKPIPFECLAFNRETEKFDNKEKDWVKEYYPDLKCSWAYASQCIADGKLELFNHKKKLLGAILDEAKELGDPTDTEEGWDIVFEKKKTGPLPINVEYALKARQLKNRPLTDEERELIADLKSMDVVLPRPTPAQQKELLDKLKQGSSENIDESVDEEFKVD